MSQLIRCSFILVLVPVIMAQKSQERLSLERAKEFAIATNFSVQASQKKLAAETSNAKKQSASYYPKLSANIGVEGASSDEGSDSTSLAYAALSYQIFNGFRDHYRVNQAELRQVQAELELSRKKFEIGLDVERAFHEYLYVKELIRSKQESLDTNKKNAKMVRRTRSAGLASKTDVMEFEYKEAVLNSELLSLKQRLEEARITLKRLLGADVKAEPAGSLQHQHLEGDLMQFLNRIKNDSFPIKLADLKRQEMDLESRKWRSGWLPSLDLEARSGFLPPEERFDPTSEDPSSSVVLLLTWELFSGLETTHSRNEGLARMAAAEFDLKESILRSVTSAESLFRRLKTIEERVELEEGNLKLSQSFYDNVAKEYQRGYKNSADLSSASDRLEESRTRRLEFMFDFLTQKLELEKVMGVPITTSVVDHSKHDHHHKAKG